MEAAAPVLGVVNPAAHWTHWIPAPLLYMPKGEREARSKKWCMKKKEEVENKMDKKKIQSKTLTYVPLGQSVHPGYAPVDEIMPPGHGPTGCFTIEKSGVLLNTEPKPGTVATITYWLT